MKTLDQLFQSFETGIRSAKSSKPKVYLQSLGLDYNTQRIGFISGQFHHRATQEIKDHYESLGLLVKSTAAVRDDSMTAYTAFGRYGIVFPLTDESGLVVNLFAIRFEMATPREEYLNDKGIYPSHPPPTTKRLYIAPSIVDAASLIQSKSLENRDAVMALHDGKLLEQHQAAIQSLTDLTDIIILKP